MNKFKRNLKKKSCQRRPGRGTRLRRGCGQQGGVNSPGRLHGADLPRSARSGTKVRLFVDVPIEPRKEPGSIRGSGVWAFCNALQALGRGGSTELKPWYRLR